MVLCRYCNEDLGCEPWLLAWGEPAHKRCYDGRKDANAVHLPLVRGVVHQEAPRLQRKVRRYDSKAGGRSR